MKTFTYLVTYITMKVHTKLKFIYCKCVHLSLELNSGSSGGSSYNPASSSTNNLVVTINQVVVCFVSWWSIIITSDNDIVCCKIWLLSTKISFVVAIKSYNNKQLSYNACKIAAITCSQFISEISHYCYHIKQVTEMFVIFCSI